MSATHALPPYISHHQKAIHKTDSLQEKSGILFFTYKIETHVCFRLTTMFIKLL